ncbi:MFS transporter [Saccharopolyspora spinosa]|uniref:MFS transporter n=1 Tax=Saccharopolyspora spinosa TaxID=60894 RepID=UPI0002378FB6|nr:MFS transporter [Saccharopolyspora spinosa]
MLGVGRPAGGHPAVGFVMRPVGAAVLGAYADRNGRKKGLTLTIGLMAGSSFVIALTPNYDTIGLFASVILLVARLVQGFSADGEFGLSSAFLVAATTPGRRAFAVSWQQVSVGGCTLMLRVSVEDTESHRHHSP